ncbi:ABC transporter ATP-binding protein [Candidatus Hodarchaeum mangrovi]
MTLAIETYHLTKIFSPNIIALNDFSLGIKEGTIFGLLGPNGAGKTTTIRILTTLISPTNGHALVNGYQLDSDQIKIRKTVGVQTDSPNLYLRLSAKRNLLFFAKMYGLTHEEALKRIKELTRQFRLEDRLENAVGSYSRGMKQKLGIIRAIIHEPSILFLDEPTASLDPIAQGEVRTMIIQLAKVFNKTIIMASHNLPEVEKLTDKIGVISSGRLIALGSPLELRSMLGQDDKLVIQSSIDLTPFKEILSTLKGVKNILLTSDSSKIVIEIKNYCETAPSIVEELVKHKVPILSVTQQKESLENIYAEIMSLNGEK